DVIIECVGTSESLQQCLNSVRPGGTVSFLGLFWEPFTLNVTDFFLRNLTLRGGVASSRTYIPKLLPMVEENKFDPTLVISHRISLDEVPKGYELMDNRTEDALKIVFRP
ncbi:MAG: zinc-binding dehydrogenase, partial [Nanoarchaeota archaeon]|nr:zinc-binding dehydrogenase [Nanoarchaeota archaeon]